ncbi:MAG: hypothetical protein IPG90_05710 [Bacteroidetes bacterium]|nr:hypothetical protein [Bacteroidota bacterium]
MTHLDVELKRLKEEKIEMFDLVISQFELLQVTRLEEMWSTAIEMLSDVQRAFDADDAKLSRGVFKKDDILDEVNSNANDVIEHYIKSHPDKIAQALHIVSTIRKLERTGDQTKNISEEIIFFLEAKVLKHLSEKAKSE